MPPLSNFHFPIPPWEHWAADFDPTPHAWVETTEFGSVRQWLLKERDGWIYFRAPQLGENGRVKAMFGLEKRALVGIGKDAAQLEAFFREEWAAGRWGLYFPLRNGAMGFFAPDGRAWGRIWWENATNCAFEWKVPDDWNLEQIFEADLTHYRYRGFWDEKFPFLRPHKEKIPWFAWTPQSCLTADVFWSRGSWEGLKQVSRWIVQSDVNIRWEQCEFAELQGQCGTPRAAPEWSYYSSSPDYNHYDDGARTRWLLEWAVRQNVPMGQQWRKTRSGWNCFHHSLLARVEGPPSAHERMEAIWNLKRCLEPDFSAEEIEFLLFGDGATLGAWVKAMKILGIGKGEYGWANAILN